MGGLAGEAENGGLRLDFDGQPRQGFGGAKVTTAKRSTIYVPTDAGVDQDVSVFLSSDDPFLAERPMYFNYQGTGAWGWTGGHDVVGFVP